MTVVRLPSELLDYVLTFVPDVSLQSTALSLLYADPTLKISRANLCRHLSISREGQAWQCTQRLRGAKSSNGDGIEHGDLRQSVRTLSVEIWRDDPQLLINLAGVLPRLESLRLSIGPLFAPDHLEELLESPLWRGTIDQAWFRFNPYVSERSYYTFLKGAYFDVAPALISKWTSEVVPNFRRLAFIQDLPPNHGYARKAIPAFGLTELDTEINNLNPSTSSSASAGTPTRYSSEPVIGDFAQPIVFFSLSSFTTLALSPIGGKLQNMVIRLPRRNLLTALTDFSPGQMPFRSLRHLDLSTSHVICDTRLPLLLRTFHKLEHLVLDRCTGLISVKESMEQAPSPTMRWLGKCCGGVGIARADEILKTWRKYSKSRSVAPSTEPSTSRQPLSHLPPSRPGRLKAQGKIPNPKGKSESIPASVGSILASEGPFSMVKELMMIPPIPNLKSLGLGLHDIDARTDAAWRAEFDEGFQDAMLKTIDRIEQYIHRWESWRLEGKLEDGSRRMVTLRDPLADGFKVSEPDTGFAQFCSVNGLVNINPEGALDVIDKLKQLRVTICTTPDCSGAAGIPHLSLNNVSRESADDRRIKEQDIRERERLDRVNWRKGSSSHQPFCAHLKTREDWGEDR